MKQPRKNERPVPRSRSGMIGRRSERTGTEPVTAQSALGLRTVLAAAALPLFVVGAVGFGWWAASDPDGSPGADVLRWFAVACGLLALLAVTNLVVLLRRRSRESP